MKLPKIFRKPGIKFPIKLALDIAKRQFSAMQMVTADEKLVTEIASQLRYVPEMWLYIHPKHPFYAQSSQDIRDMWPELPKDCLILVHSSERWCLVAHGANLVPMIFLHRADSTRFYRLLDQRTIKWVPVLLKDMSSMLITGSFMGGEDFNDLPQVTEPTSPELTQPLDSVSQKTGAGFRL